MAQCFDNGEFKETDYKSGESTGQLDSYGVCHEGYRFERLRTQAADSVNGGDALTNNDQILANALNSIGALQEKFASLPPNYQEMVLSSFASHMTGENYPLYDHFRSYRAGAA